MTCRGKRPGVSAAEPAATNLSAVSIALEFLAGT